MKKYFKSYEYMLVLVGIFIQCTIMNFVKFITNPSATNLLLFVTHWLIAVLFASNYDIRVYGNKE